MKKSTCEETGFECSLYKIEVLAVTNWFTRLEKHQTIENLLRVDFLRIFKKIMHFSRFFDFFLNSIVADAYMVKCTLLYLNIVGQTQ